MLSIRIVLVGEKFGSVEASSTYDAACGTALQLKRMTSNGWNVEYA
jgi:hypothetical protein